VPVFLSVLLVLASPRIITGHFCHVTFEEVGVTDDGSLSYKYSTFSSMNTKIGGSTCPHIPFHWYTRCYGSSAWLDDLTGFVPDASHRNQGFKVEKGRTYKLKPGERLVIYEFHNPDTGETYQDFIEFETLD
jgi:hypothetical protein